MFIEKRTIREVDGTKNCSTTAIDGMNQSNYCST